MRHLKNEWDQFKDCSIVGILKQRLKLVHSVLGNCHYLPLQRLWSTMKHPTRRRIVKLLLSMSATAATPCQTIYLLLHCVFDYHIWYHGLIGCPWFSKMDRPPHPAPCTFFRHLRRRFGNFCCGARNSVCWWGRHHKNMTYLLVVKNCWQANILYMRVL